MTTAPDGLFQYGGAPVGGNPYFGMWGESVWFVDYDSGNKDGPGDKPSNALKYVGDAISKAAANDVIYVRPRTPNSLNYDPNYILPEGTTNDVIPYAKHGLAIIGTGYGRGQGSQFYTYWRGTGTATATATLIIRAPWTLIENISFHDGASTSSQCILLDGQAANSGYVCGNTISNSMFRFSGNTALSIDSCMWATVLDNTFHKGAGITISSNEQVPDGIEVGRNRFVALTAGSVDCGMYVLAADAINVHDNIFAHDKPTAGTAKYIYFHTASTGVVANNFFGTATLVTATLMTLNGVLESGSQCSLGFLTS